MGLNQLGIDLNQIIQKIPKPVLIVGVLVIAIVFFVYNDPLRDECEVQISIFEKKTAGLLSSIRNKNKKTQFPKIEFWKNRCRAGNSIGSCSDYFEGLRFITKELREVKDSCQINYSVQNEKFLNQITQALQIMSLVAWGEKPPAGMAERIGWLNETHIRTFCYLKKTFILIGSEESFLVLRDKVYKEFPGEWSEKFDFNKLVQSSTADNKAESDDDDEDGVDVAKLVAENRPRAYKTNLNPTGKLKNEEIYERSIFSIRCDLYM
ncbi:MAG: hypothetical protein AABY53_03225 [Bdellovibrionota bacterium]